jgi:hypothetical protein
MNIRSLSSLVFLRVFVFELMNHIDNTTTTTSIAIVTLYCSKNIEEGRATTAPSQEWLLAE